MARAPKRRSQRVSLYLLASVEQDAVVLDVYNAGKVHDRAQDLFRTAIFRGLRSMFETGDIPEMVLAHHNLAQRLGRRQAKHAALAPPLPPASPQPFQSLPDPAFQPPLSTPVFDAPAPKVEDAEPDPEDFLGLMGGAKPMTRESA